MLHALAIEAERRGWKASQPAKSTMRTQGQALWIGDPDGHLVITIERTDVILRLREDGIRTRSVYPERPRYRDPWESESSARRRSFEFEAEATGLLELSVLSPHSPSLRPSVWRDGKTQTIESQLPAVLWEVEARAAEDRERIREEERERDRRRVQWEAAVGVARDKHLEHHRMTVLEHQALAWQRASAIRAYCDVIDREAGNDTNALAWAPGIEREPRRSTH